MRLDDFGNDVNVEDQGRGGGGFGLPMGGGGFGLPFGGGGIGCGGLLLLIVGAWLFGINPLALLSGGGVGTGVGPAPVQRQMQSRDPQVVCNEDPQKHFSCNVLASLNKTWPNLIGDYQPPKLSFYSQSGSSGCGAAQAAMGPFYCPSDSTVYLDTDFYTELRDRFGAAGDAAQAYVIAHEVGHHIQNLLGTSDKVSQAQQAAGSRVAANRLSVLLELQADCYAGVWAATARNRAGQPVLEPGEAQQALRAAAAIGDDTLQKETQGRVVPESFTHGTSAQRQYWLNRGLANGDPKQCDTFAGGDQS